jgi:hypothetical protein
MRALRLLEWKSDPVLVEVADPDPDPDPDPVPGPVVVPADAG